LNGTNQLLVYTDDRHGTQNTEMLLVVSKGVAVELNAEKISNYMFMSRQLHAKQIHNVQAATQPFENVSRSRCVGKTFKNHSRMHESIKSRLNSGGGGGGSWELLSRNFIFPFQTENMNIKLRMTTVLCGVFYGCETWSLTLREKHMLVVLEVIL
jgi:hypothetical protein